MTGHREDLESPTPRPAAAAGSTPLQVASRAATSAVLAGAAFYHPLLLGGIAGVIVLLVVGVVWPAVWSRDRQRRKAAVNVLRELLDAFFPARSRF
ncbi:MAG TPA: hypothetical protein VHH34_00390 [Pseudonocardiaceae bacterium]|nr:hypothetical protein [Pseudonocardiaceae bacterium]